MNLDAIWHDLECGEYTEDLALWHELADRTGGPLLDIGAGTGRVTLELAARGVEVVALDSCAPLLTALERRGEGLRVSTTAADARDFRLDRQFSLILVPMQTLQLLGGRSGRGAFLRCARVHLRSGGLLVAALADAMDCFDDEHELPPPPQERVILGVRYSSQLLRVVEDGGRAAIHRRREIDGSETQEVVVHLDRVSADRVSAEARELGFIPEPPRYIDDTEQYLGSTVVVLRAPESH